MTSDVSAPRTTPTEVVPGIWQLPIPLRVRVEPVNAWILRDDDGALTVFDTGIATGAADLWRRAFADIGQHPADVRQIVVSHHHPDHIGGTGALHRLTRAPVLASRSTIQQAPDVWGDAGRRDGYFAAMDAHVREHGVPEDVVTSLEHEAELARLAVELPPDSAWQPLDADDRIVVGDRTWRMRLTPGHADGHLVLHDEQGRLLLAGDHLLERISPAVGRFPRHERDPLARYLESLVAVAMLDIDLVLPGHGAPFTGARARARALVEHHRARVEACVAAVAQLGDASAFDAARIAFARVFEAPDPEPTNLRFATTETLAHLERARADGRVSRARGADGIVRFRAVAP